MEILELLIDKIPIVDVMAFRQLECDRRRIDLVPSQAVFDEREEHMFLQLIERNVDAHLEVRHVFLPALCGRHRVFDDPMPDGNDHSRFFEHRDELHRRHHTAVAIIPTEQCLRTDQVPVLRVDLRLIAQEEVFATLCNAVLH